MHARRCKCSCKVCNVRPRRHAARSTLPHLQQRVAIAVGQVVLQARQPRLVVIRKVKLFKSQAGLRADDEALVALRQQQAADLQAALAAGPGRGWDGCRARGASEVVWAVHARGRSGSCGAAEAASRQRLQAALRVTQVAALQRAR